MPVVILVFLVFLFLCALSVNWDQTFVNWGWNWSNGILIALITIILNLK